MLRTRGGQLVMEFVHEDSWDFSGVDTQYATHGLHTYLAAMIPQIAGRLIEMYVPPAGSVLDPFCGGGAVLVESILNGREAAGRDINGLAALISQAKTTYVPQSKIRVTRMQVLERALAFRGDPIQFAPTDHVAYWFKSESMQPLTALRYGVEDIEDEDMKNLFRVIFSATVRDVSLTYRNEIRLRRMTNEEQARFNPEPFHRFETRARLAELQVGQLPAGARADVHMGDVLNLDFRDDEFTAIICSPPYGDERNGVPYVQFARNMLMWLGFTRHDVMETKRRTLGWGKDGKHPPSSATLLRALDRISHYPTTHREGVAFYADYYEALKEMVRVASQRIMIVIGQRVLQGTIFDNAAITIELLADLGVGLEAHYHRKLPSKRLPRMREFGAAIDEESILVFCK